MNIENCNDPLVMASIKEQIDLLSKGSITCLELIQRTFKRIDTVNRIYNAIITEVDRSQVICQAKQTDRERARGRKIGRLAGVPFTVKDSIATAGVRTTSGANENYNLIPSKNALVVDRIQAEGAILIGKTNLPRYSLDLVTKNEIFGETNNPWNIKHTCGGSSGGSAVAVVTGMSSFDIGSDLAGSLRIPAHCSGAVAHKPTYGIVPLEGHLASVDGLDEEMNVFGPIARDPLDLSLLLNIISGPSIPHSKAWKLSLPPKKDSPYRIATWLDDPYCKVSTSVLHVLSKVVDEIIKMGFLEYVPIKPEFSLENSDKVFRDIVDAMNLPRLLLEARPNTPRAKNFSYIDWLNIESRRNRLLQAWEVFFKSVDVMLCPILPTTAPLHSDCEKEFRQRTLSIDAMDRQFTDLLTWPGLASLAGLPSTAVYIGLTEDNLPVGLQVIGSWYEDHKCIDVASIIHKSSSPPLWTLNSIF